MRITSGFEVFALAVVISGIPALSGCASGPTTKSDAVAAAEPNTAATISFYRPNNGPVGAAVKYETFVDGALVGQLDSRARFSVKVTPGTREVVVFPRLKGIGIPGDTSYKLNIELKPREHYYVRFNIDLKGVSVYGKSAVADSSTTLAEVSEADWASGK